MRYHSVFILIVDLDLKEFCDALGRPHFNRIPSHTFADVDANLAANTLIKSNLHIRNDDIHPVRGIARRMFNAVDRAEADTRFTARTVVRDNDRNLLRFLFLPSDLGRSFRDDQCWIRLLWIVCHY